LSSLGADEIAAVAAGSGLFQELSSNSGLFEEFDGAALFDRIGAFAAESGVFEDVAAVVADSGLQVLSGQTTEDRREVEQGGPRGVQLTDLYYLVYTMYNIMALFSLEVKQANN